eukprot:1177019-Prorocentrum_minimum.AAC.12
MRGTNVQKAVLPTSRTPRIPTERACRREAVRAVQAAVRQNAAFVVARRSRERSAVCTTVPTF